MSKYYINQPLAITVTLSHDMADLTGVASVAIDYKNPDGVTGSWTGVLDSTAGTITYDVPVDILSVAGTWIMQPELTLTTGDVYHGTVSRFVISDFYK